MASFVNEHSVALKKPPEPARRTEVLNARRELKMAQSAHAYVRGSTDRFYQWVAEQPETRIPVGPPIWICGDCHVGNLGPIGHHDGATVVELRDLDQTVVGNPAHDLLRLALSLAMACRSSDLPGATTARITEDLIAGYERSFDGESTDETIDELPSPIRPVMKSAVRRTTKQLFRDRMGASSRRIPHGRRFWPLAAEERAGTAALLKTEPVRQLVTMLAARADTARVEFLDAAFWAKGCSSLGLWRVAMLVEIVEDRKRGGQRRTRSLLDLKQAVAARSLWVGGEAPGLAHGERVVRGAQALAPALGARMTNAELLGRSVFIRELLPQDLKVELDHISVDDGRDVAFYLGKVLGRAHGRQLDAATRGRWHGELMKHRSKALHAPSWLWHALVDLVSVHEHAYLQHCHRYALAADRAGVTPEIAEALVIAHDSPSMQSAPEAADAPAPEHVPAPEHAPVPTAEDAPPIEATA